MTKQEIRSEILNKRDKRDPKLKSDSDRIIHDRVMSYISDHEIRCVLSYVSFRSEVDTHGIIQSCLEEKIQVAVPKVYGEDIRFHFIESMADLEKGYMGILEPKSDLPEWESSSVNLEQSIILVPGSVFDKVNNRIGYGKGYYDRFISEHPHLFSAGLAFSFQIIESIPTDEWDRPLDMIFTDIEL